MKRLYVLIIIILLSVIVISFYTCSTNSQYKTPLTPIVQYLPTPKFTSEAEIQFVNTIARNININEGIRMLRENLSIPDNGSTPLHNHVLFSVFNLTDEPVVFPDVRFGLKVFWYNASVHEWDIINLPPFQTVQEKTLPAHLSTYKADVDNWWLISEKHFVNIPHRELRIYIAGTGSISGKKYGAYMDIRLTPS